MHEGPSITVKKSVFRGTVFAFRPMRRPARW